MVRKLRADAAAQKFADDCGRFKQIFPPRERSQLDKNMKLLETACSLYELSFDSEQKREIQRFLVQKVWKILLKIYTIINDCQISIKFLVLCSQSVMSLQLLMLAYHVQEKEELEVMLQKGKGNEVEKSKAQRVRNLNMINVQ